MKDERSGTPAGLRRREFIKLLGGGVIIVVSLDERVSGQEPVRRQGGAGYPSDLNAYLRVGEDGRVTCFTGKVEMGQGVITSLAQMLAEELDVPLETIDMVMGDTDLCPWDMGTFGSQSTRNFGPALRAAGAEARAVLVELAAERLRVTPERLQVKEGAIWDGSRPESRLTYAQLASGRKIERHLTVKPPLKAVTSWKVAGKPTLRRDAREKVTGAAQYSGDIRLPGMLFAAVLRPPAHGARLKKLDTAQAEAVPGALLVREDELVAALHERPDEARRVLSLVKAEFELPDSKLDDENIFEHLLRVAPEERLAAQGGDLKTGESLASAIFEETYLNSYVAHAAMEPHAALVRVEGAKAVVWASTQTPFRARDEAAQALGMAPENVRVITPFVGGGFGGKTRNIQVVQAARLAKIAGKPVQVAWSREDEFFYDTFRPAAVVKVRSGVDAASRLVFWDYTVYFAGERSSQQFYDIPHHRTAVRGEWGGGRAAASAAHPFEVGAWRAPASNTNTFARECHIDLMASRTGTDPLEFRLKNLSDKRMARVLKAAAGRFGWTTAPAPSGRGFGLACADYLGTYVATMAEVAVDRRTGKVRVERIVHAQDMGQVINPEGAVLQVEGCLTMGLGYALREEVHFKNRAVLDLNFDTYDIPRFSWLPRIQAVLVESNDLAPQGGGEPAIITVGAVLANAVFDATGARLFRLPMTPRRVNSALLNYR